MLCGSPIQWPTSAVSKPIQEGTDSLICWTSAAAAAQCAPLSVEIRSWAVYGPLPKVLALATARRDGLPAASAPR